VQLQLLILVISKFDSQLPIAGIQYLLHLSSLIDNFIIGYALNKGI